MDDLIMGTIFSTVLVAFLLTPKRPTARWQFIVGAVLLGLGWTGVFVGLASDNAGILQSETLATILMAIFGSAAAILGPAFLVLALFAALRERARRH